MKSIITISFGEREMYELFEKKVLDTLSISCNNQDAIQIFEHRIKKLKLVLECIGEESLTEISNIILNFTLLTGIESESDGNYIGQYNPTTRDIERWEKWFCIHRKNICWYQKYNVLYLKE